MLPVYVRCKQGTHLPSSLSGFPQMHTPSQAPDTCPQTLCTYSVHWNGRELKLTTKVSFILWACFENLTEWFSLVEACHSTTGGFGLWGCEECFVIGGKMSKEGEMQATTASKLLVWVKIWCRGLWLWEENHKAMCETWKTASGRTETQEHRKRS